jgi:hypothetical protein
MKLVQKNDYDLLRILYYIGNGIGLHLAEATKANGPITRWTSKLESIKYEKAAGYRDFERKLPTTINEIYELEIGPNRCSISNTQQQQHQYNL